MTQFLGTRGDSYLFRAALAELDLHSVLLQYRGNRKFVVVSQLNKLKVAKAIGSLPENVNFGIKAPGDYTGILLALCSWLVNVALEPTSVRKWIRLS